MGEKCPSFMLICRCYKLHLSGRGSPHTHLCHFSGQVHFNDPCIQMYCQMLKSSVQNPTPNIQKISSEATISSQGGFVFGKCLFHVRASQSTQPILRPERWTSAARIPRPPGIIILTCLKKKKLLTICKRVRSGEIFQVFPHCCLCAY